MKNVTIPVALLLTFGVAACEPNGDEPADPQPEENGLPAEQQAFWSNLQELCGGAHPGTLEDAPEGDETFVGRDLVMHVRECEENEIKIPFHVGENRSRTWVITRTDDGLRLKHDHRHEDGVEEELTWYGGDTTDPGTENVQEFPADRETADMLPEAATNVWTVEVRPGEEFVYALRREGTDRRFRISFDVTEDVTPVPPAPWGHENGETEMSPQPDDDEGVEGIDDEEGEA